jgi:eukaryotic-like serine/threonine-protein kinase
VEGSSVPPTRLGDYRLIREIGRGGMGIVYEAEQVSLGRLVALKLLPYTASLDPRSVQRFQVEVQAAAHLHHPHIVPVHAVGCESGIHYYAMQLISGHSLAAIIGQFRESEQVHGQTLGKRGRTEVITDADTRRGPLIGQPGYESFYREVARLGVQAAEALEHAHRLGVVHRDIKPANLLVDQHNHPWVTDFGLARLQGDSGITITGDLLGTLRYMSPEQARAPRGVIDHRTDLYSLGVTLYEVLVLRPAFALNDLPALFHQVANEEPVAPRRLDPRIPRDLETIVLKAMAREPAERYNSAQELADDLKRFVDNQPILARGPTFVERAARWSRRHRGFVVSAGLALVLAIILLSISTAMIWQALSRTAQVSLVRAQELKRSQANLELAHRALDLYLNTAETMFPRDPGGNLQEKVLLETALTFYEQIAAQNNTDPEVKMRTVDAYSRVGSIRAALGDPYGAEDAYRKATSLTAELLETELTNDRSRSTMAAVLEKYSDLLRRHSVYVAAEWAAEESVRLLRQVVSRNPQNTQYRLALGRALNQMAGIEGETGRVAMAVANSRDALEIVQTAGSATEISGPDRVVLDQVLAAIYSNLGRWLQLDGKFAAAEEVFGKAMSLLNRLERAGGRTSATRESLTVCQAIMGELLLSTRRNADAEVLFKQAMHGFEGLAADFPGVPRYKKQLARLYDALSTIYLASDRVPDSVEASRRATILDPKLHECQQAVLNNLAWYLLTAPNPAARNPLKALELSRKAVELSPQCWASWNTLGVAHFRNGQWAAAGKALTTAQEKNPGANAFDGYFLAMTLWQQGRQQAARQWLQKAEQWRLRNRPDDLELLRFRTEAEQLVGPFRGLCGSARPLTPSSVAEALKDPSFGLPPPCPSGDINGTELGKRASCPHTLTERPAPHALDLLGPALFFIDLT